MLNFMPIVYDLNTWEKLISFKYEYLLICQWVISSNDVEGMANSVVPDQPDLTGAIWSESTLFIQACLSVNIRSLRYHESY